MNSKRQRGFTLIELIIFIVVVSIGLAGILSVINTVVKSSADPMVRKQTIAIAESLLEEILLKEYQDPVLGTCTQGTAGQRYLWDDVCDYNNYATTNGIVYPDQTATPVSGLHSYNISPVVVDATATLGTLTVRRVTVSVTDPQGAVVSLTGYRAKY